MRAELDAFTATVGVPVVYEESVGSEEISPFEELMLRIEGDEPPDVIIVPPWFLAEVADQLVDLVELVEPGELHEAFGEYLIESATAHNGAVLGAPIRVTNLKTLV